MNFDTIVIGAGINGCSAAANLAYWGVETLLLEKFTLPHIRGSSHGHSRIIRKAYPQQFYTDLMPEAYRIWRSLEEFSGEQLIVPTQYLTLSEGSLSECRKKGSLADTEKCLNNIGSVSYWLDERQIAEKYPTMNFPHHSALMDPEGGALRADKCLTTCLNYFKSKKGTVHDGEEVISIKPGHTIHVTTTKRTYTCQHLIITAGAWNKDLLRSIGLHLPLQVATVPVCYWKETVPGSHGPDKQPSAFVNAGLLVPRREDFYMIPSIEYPGHVKVCWHFGVPVSDPDRRDDVLVDKMVQTLSSVVQKHLPGLESGRGPAIVEKCMYTVTPDRNFILDNHPQWSNIAIGAGFSGHGFKMAPVTGKLLSELALGRKPSYDITPFSIKRFKGQTRFSQQPSL